MSSRTVAATIDDVFSAWTDPAHLRKWWGPAGFTNTFHEFDLRPGGRWKFTMHGPEQGNYQNECEFITIERPKFIAWQRISKPIFQVTANFEEVDESTTHITFKMLFNSAAECSKIKPFAVEKNEENFDRLAAELQQMKMP